MRVFKNALLMMRTRGFAGPNFVNSVKSNGNYVSLFKFRFGGTILLKVDENNTSTVFGFSSSNPESYGDIVPTIADGQDVYQFTADNVTDDVVLAFGKSGNKQINGWASFNLAYVSNGAESVENQIVEEDTLTWNGVTYNVIDQTLTDYIVNSSGTQIKFKVGAP